MTASEMLLKAATVIRTQLACQGIQGEALYVCAVSEAALNEPNRLARATTKFVVHALVRLALTGDPGPCLMGQLDKMTPEAIADLCDLAGSPAMLDKLHGFDPSAARRNPKHWSEGDD